MASSPQDLCDLLGTRYPIVQGGMIWVSGARLTAAVSNAGCFGLIGTGSMRPDLFREHLAKARTLTDRPFGVNVPQIYKHADAIIEILLEDPVHAVFTSAGSPKRYTAALQQRGMRVFHVVSSPALAEKTLAVGVDGVVVEGIEAGGHNGRDELSTWIAAAQVARATERPVLAAGGVATGGHIAAALALGCSGVQIGTRFAATIESSAHEGFKGAMVSSQSADTAMYMRRLVPVRLIGNAFARRIRQMEDAGADSDALEQELGQGRARRGMFEGELEEGELEIGQAVGYVQEIQAVGAVVTSLVDEYRNAVAALPEQLDLGDAE